MWRAAAIVTFTGCSFAFVRGPSPDRTTCTHSYAAPIADTVIATGDVVVVGTAAIYGFGNNESSRDTGTVAMKGLGTAFALLSFIPFMLSTLHGYPSVAACRAAH